MPQQVSRFFIAVSTIAMTAAILHHLIGVI